jgi:hypothetical protein
MGLADLGLEVAISLSNVLLFGAILGLDCLRLALPWPQVHAPLPTFDQAVLLRSRSA